MTNLTFLEPVQIQVVFPQRFNIERYAGTEQFVSVTDVLEPHDNLATISDLMLKERVAMYLDFPVEEMSNMQVSRPTENSILIFGKYQFGSDRQYSVDNLENSPWYLDKIGITYQLSGFIFEGKGVSLSLRLPDALNLDSINDTYLLSPTIEEWAAILQQSNDPLLLIENKKPWIRKAQYIISGFVQQKIWVRDGLKCMYCQKQMGDVQLTIDHFVPLELGGLNNQTNYLSACRHDNKDKGSMHPKQFCDMKGLDYQYYVDYLKSQN